jgi:CheY-like chemotaxis protein
VRHERRNGCEHRCREERESADKDAQAHVPLTMGARACRGNPPGEGAWNEHEAPFLSKADALGSSYREGSPTASAESRGATLRLIVADDDEGARAHLRTPFEDGGDAHIVGEAADGVEAVALALEHAPDLVLLDVHMPRLNGMEAAEQIREAAPETAILLHTGELTEELTKRAGRLGLRLVAKSALGDGSAALSTL